MPIELHTQKAYSYTLIPITEQLQSINFKTQMYKEERGKADLH